MSGKFWVSIEAEPYKFFNDIESAVRFYQIAIEPLKRRRPRPASFRRQHNRVLAALSGGKEIEKVYAA
jgi:hypothetical protein